jgi:isopentenyl-diphosphate delta-isomerase
VNKSEKRKKDHIQLAFEAQVNTGPDPRFIYEPLLSGHPRGQNTELTFLGKKMKAPLWVSSMTGGTTHAASINERLAAVCKKFGLGMGLGSCRPLLESDEYLQDFDIRDTIGEDCPLYANLGIAQIEALVNQNQVSKLKSLVEKLRADGLIVHINPLQEWVQPGGDRYFNAPIDTIKRVLDIQDINLIVKEVGQGMGYESLKALSRLPLSAIEFAAFGGTNFSKLEMLRKGKEEIDPLFQIGHTVVEMIDYMNLLDLELGEDMKCREIIISGGLKNYLDGYYAISKAKLPAVYGQASTFLKYALNSYEALEGFIENQINGLMLAQRFLKLRK